MEIRRATRKFMLLAAWLGGSALPAQAQYQSFYATGDQSRPTGYQSAFATEASLAERTKGAGYYIPPHEAQSPYLFKERPAAHAAMMQPPMGMPGPMPAQMQGPMPGQMQGPMQASMEMPMGGEAPYGPPMGYAGGCESCGDAACAGGCGAGQGLLGRMLGPYGDCSCGPRWYDASVEFLYMKRDRVSRLQNFTSDGIPGNAPPNIVLSTEDLDFDWAPGARVSLRHELGAATAIEATYLGLYGMDTSAQATSDTDNLFSVMSGFGNPPFFLGFTDTDRSNFQSISYESELHSVELNLRRQFVTGDERWHGSWLLGVRYVNLNEDFTYFTQSTFNNGQMNYAVDTSNDMVGFQLGGDLNACVLPGLMIGAEAKAGVYGNQAVQNTRIVATSLDLEERASEDDVALVAEGRVIAAWQIRPNLTLTGGYQALLVDGVALGPDNFNATPPFVNPGARAASVTVNTNDTVFYHGFTGGLELLW